MFGVSINSKLKNLLISIIWALSMAIIIACKLVRPSPRLILFSDDFSVNKSQWETWYQENVSAVSIVNEELVMILEEPNADMVTTNRITNFNVETSVTVNRKHGTDDNLMGIVCRYIKPRNYYSFLISSDGYYGIAKKSKGNTQLISSDHMQYDEVINKGSQKNQLTAICEKGTFSFYVNEKELISLQDEDAFLTGGNGLIIGTFSGTDDLIIGFDDYIIQAR